MLSQSGLKSGSSLAARFTVCSSMVTAFFNQFLICLRVIPQLQPALGSLQVESVGWFERTHCRRSFSLGF
jgi:hypothetical protein